MKTSIALGRIAAVAVIAAAAATAGPANAAEDSPQGNGATTVILNPALVPTLTDVLHVRPLAPGRLSAPGGVAQVSFPITTQKAGVIQHVGGLEFTPVAGGDLRVTHFAVDTNSGYLTSRARLDGKWLNDRINLFQLGSIQPINGAVPACDGTPAGLTLTSAAASALGAPSFAGAFVGDACVLPASNGDDG